MKTEDWNPSEAGRSAAREAGMDDFTLASELVAFAQWHREANTKPTRVDALWREWVKRWKAAKTAYKATDGVLATQVYLDSQKRHREASSPPPDAILALRNRWRRTTQ